jgi:hypothetical protein
MTKYTDDRDSRKLFRSGTSIAVTLPPMFLKILEAKAHFKIEKIRAEVDDDNMEIILRPVLNHDG